VARTRYESEGERDKEREKDPDNASPSWSPRTRRGPTDPNIRPDVQAGPDVTTWGGRRTLLVDQAAPAPNASPSPEAVRRRPSPTEDGDREALRPWFDKLRRPQDEERNRPAARPREEQASPRQRSRPEDSPRPEARPVRAEPKRDRERQSPPPPPPPPSNDGGRDRGAVRRDRSRDHQ
jgi:hypothetical protein